MTTLLELKGINKTFPGVKALSDVSIDLKAGEVLGLCGENGAGKSTLMKVLTGIYTADPGGHIFLDGKEVHVHGIQHAQSLGLSIIHQELNLVRDLTVAQNIYLGRPGATKFGYISDSKMIADAQKLFDDLGIDINPKTMCGHLSVARQQMVEIAKALSHDSRILVMDEPTASLTEQETETLFQLIRNFVTDETGLIYISHRMPEIEEITDRVSVLRDGQYIGTVTTKESSIKEIISMMVGREVSAEARPKTIVQSDEVVLKVDNLSTKRLLKHVSFDLHKGEILGFAGLMGAGRTEVARCLFGADPYTEGTITVHGKKQNMKRTSDAVKSGIAYLSEDRKHFGLLLDQDVRWNTMLTAMDKGMTGGLVDDKKIATNTQKYVDQLKTKTPSIKQLLRNLSGGNQQKVVIAKWLVRDTDILIFDEPTRGIDVGAKEEIYGLLEELIAQGKSIIMISSELPEVLRMSHRIAVMCNGEITGILDNKDATQERIMELATEAEKKNGAKK
ncbi:MAG: sugar ABC transporter ATP-binding protein [Actinomycetaceae bacterium]|nr:sugar ABC transporter ATP-binding protein [Actinomycetaceae bacterium]